MSDSKERQSDRKAEKRTWVALQEAASRVTRQRLAAGLKNKDEKDFSGVHGS